MIRVGLVGAGGMGRNHLRCYREIPSAKIVAICDVSAPELRQAGSIALRKTPDNPDPMGLDGIAIYDDYAELLQNPEVDLVDICLPSPLHAPVTVAALDAGKHVFCEKPMAMNARECDDMQAAWKRSGRHLSIGHSLRYMPQYTAAHQLITSGRFGAPVYARFHRSGGRPVGSYNNWLVSASQSGGVVLDLHIHDIDNAHWWFGRNYTATTQGLLDHDLPVQVDSTWRYVDGPMVYLHAGWDRSTTAPFRFAFYVQMERGSVMYDSSIDTESLRIHPVDGAPETIPFENISPNLLQITDVLACIERNEPTSRVTPEDGAAAVEAANRTLEAIQRG